MKHRSILFDYVSKLKQKYKAHLIIWYYLYLYENSLMADLNDLLHK